MERQFNRLFDTPLWIVHNTEFDNDRLLADVEEHSKKTPTEYFSNRGGYQGHNFSDDELFAFINENIPIHPDKPVSEYSLSAWVNINKPGSYNVRHTHTNTDTLLSGIYYVKVPEGSGNVRFWDPRGHWLQTMKDTDYYNDLRSFYEIPPKPGLLLFFPCWLEHEVTENESSENRVSIAFNITIHTYNQSMPDYLFSKLDS